jgi:Fe2+ or Zn2+ uptake regulation protein
MSEKYIKLLHSRGFRVTPQRLAILKILQEANRHMTPSEVNKQAQEIVPGLTPTTVYRTLNFLTEQGLVLDTHIGGGQLVYEIAGHNHHHLICRSCKRTFQIEQNLLDELDQRIEESTGFEIESVHLTFFGLCADCRKKESINE